MGAQATGTNPSGAVPSDLDIAQAATLRPILEVAAEVGIQEDELELHGRYKAKVELSILERLRDRPQGKYIDVTAITPTPLGEGKTVTTVGLSRRRARPSVSRAVRPAAVTPRSSRWRTSTST